MTTEQVIRNREKAEAMVETLRRAVESGVVWNAEFEVIKSGLNFAVWRDTEAYVWPAMLVQHVGEAFKFPGSPSSVHDIRSFSKKIEAGRSKGVAVPASVDEFLAFWVPVVALFDQAKPLIKKGRKPSDDPAKTPPRTLEHTGTCPVCDRNIKLGDSGRIVSHGYQIAWNSRHGDCFGVGHRPFEESAEGAIKFREQVVKQIAVNNELLANARAGKVEEVYNKRTRAFVKKGEERFNDLLRTRIQELEYEVRSLSRLADRFQIKIEGWAPATLPGIVAGFAR